MIRKIRPGQFAAEVRDCRQPVLLEFYASWCPRCAMMDDVLEEFASANRGKIKVCRIDEADAALLMEEYGIDRVPSFLAFSGGRVTAVKAGTATVTAQVNDKKLTCIVRSNIEGSVVADDSNAENTGSGSTGGNQLDHTDVTLAVGQSFEISVVNGVSGGWNVTDGSVITVDGKGNVTALASGTAKVYTIVNGQRLECIVRVP